MIDVILIHLMMIAVVAATVTAEWRDARERNRRRIWRAKRADNVIEPGQVQGKRG